VKATPRQGTWSAPGVSAERIRALAIPPGWRSATISKDPDADLQVIGTDAKGRPQYRYSEAFSKSKAAEKFERIGTFNAVAQRLGDATADAMAKGNDAAAAVRLMLMTGMRPGSENDTGAEKKAHGATNLRKSHVRVEGDTVHYAFVGKEGVDIKNSVTDGALAAYISQKAAGSPSDRLFNTDETKARQYLKSICGNEFKSKDLRTLKANTMAKDLVAARGVPASDAEYRKAVNEVGDMVASQLGNTRVMALGSYINPAVFDAWRMAMTDKPTTDAAPAPKNSMEEWKRGSAALRGLFDSISYAGNVRPKMADADGDEGND
jgi:DNA topoisomerase-1